MSEQTSTRTHAGAWNMTSGALLVLAPAMSWTGAVIDHDGLMVAGVVSLALLIVAKWSAGRDLDRLLDAVAEEAISRYRADVRDLPSPPSAGGEVSASQRRPGQWNEAATHAVYRANKSAGRAVGT